MSELELGMNIKPITERFTLSNEFKNMLKQQEVIWLNKYHKDVYNNLKKYMNKSELSDLKQACLKI